MTYRIVKFKINQGHRENGRIGECDSFRSVRSTLMQCPQHAYIVSRTSLYRVSRTRSYSVQNKLIQSVQNTLIQCSEHADIVSRTRLYSVQKTLIVQCPERRLPTLRIFPQTYGIQKMIHISPDFYTEFQNFRIFFGFCNFLIFFQHFIS